MTAGAAAWGCGLARSDLHLDVRLAERRAEPPGRRAAVGRTSRFTAIVPLPFGRAAAQVRTALIGSVKDLLAQLVKSVTWDQGTEMADHALSLWRRASMSILRILIHRGSAARTRTRTGSSGNTFRKGHQFLLIRCS